MATNQTYDQAVAAVNSGQFARRAGWGPNKYLGQTGGKVFSYSGAAGVSQTVPTAFNKKPARTAVGAVGPVVAGKPSDSTSYWESPGGRHDIGPDPRFPEMDQRGYQSHPGITRQSVAAAGNSIYNASEEDRAATDWVTGPDSKQLV